MSSMEALSRRLVALTKGNVADLEDLLKGAVKAHSRRLKDGRVIQVKEAQRKDQGPRQGYKKPEGLSAHASKLHDILSKHGRTNRTAAHQLLAREVQEAVSDEQFDKALGELSIRQRGKKIGLKHGDMVRNPKGGPVDKMHSGRDRAALVKFMGRAGLPQAVRQLKAQYDAATTDKAKARVLDQVRKHYAEYQEAKTKARAEGSERYKARREGAAKKKAEREERGKARSERVKASRSADVEKKKARDAKDKDRMDRFTPKAKPEGLVGHASTAYDVLKQIGPRTVDWRVLKAKMRQESGKQVSDSETFAAIRDLYEAGIISHPRTKDGEDMDRNKVKLRGKMAPARKARRSRLWW